MSSKVLSVTQQWYRFKVSPMVTNKCNKCGYIPSKDNWDILAHVISGSKTDQPRVEKVCRACLDEIRKSDR